MASKAQLRQRFKNILKEKENLKLQDDLSLSKNLKSLFQELKIIGKQKVLGGYSPMRYEPAWFKELGKGDFRYSLVHMHKNIELSYHQIEFQKLVNGNYKLCLPENERRACVNPDLILVPGLAFSDQCERLGRGRAYFDSFMKSYQGIKIGIFYSYQKCIELECEEHDEKLDYIVTDKEIIRGI